MDLNEEKGVNRVWGTWAWGYIFVQSGCYSPKKLKANFQDEGERHLFCSLMYPKSLEQRLAHGKLSMNICCMYKAIYLHFQD